MFPLKCSTYAGRAQKAALDNGRMQRFKKPSDKTDLLSNQLYVCSRVLNSV